MDDEHDHEHGSGASESVADGERHPTFGKPQPRVGLVIRAAGFETFRELAEAVPCVHELISGVRNGKRPMSAGLRRRLAEILEVPEDDVMSALTESPDATSPALDAHRLSLLTALSARIDLLVEHEGDDENELRTLPGPMVPQETWTEVARDVGCTTRTLARLRREADLPTERMIGRLSHALLTPPETALFALRRTPLAWRW